KLLVGTDTGNNSFTPYGELHAKELEIFVKYGGYTPMEAIVAATRDNAYAVGLEGQVGEVAPGKLADIIVLNKDPIADITVLQGGKHLAWVIKDGRTVDLDGRDQMLTFQQAAEEQAGRRRWLIGYDGSSFVRFPLLHRRHAHGHFEALATRCKNDAVDRRDIGVVAADGEHDVVIAGENAVGRIKPAPADIL